MKTPNTRKNSGRARGAPLGQHFLTRPIIAGYVAEAALVTKGDTVLEIGPGKGILTNQLLVRGARVVAIEKDAQLVRELRMTFTQACADQHLHIIEDDIRNLDVTKLPTVVGNPYKLVANIPYYITGHIIRLFLTIQHQPSLMSLLVQKEVAERIIAADRKESLLSLSVKAYGEPTLTRIVKSGAFSPPPRVDSAILRVQSISRTHFSTSLVEETYFNILHRAFRGKRKQIGTTLGKDFAPVFERCGVNMKARPEDVSQESWLCIANAIALERS